MTALDSQTLTDLSALLSRHGDSRATRELLLFWALHPHARFSRLAILCATECSRSEVNKALGNMVQNGLVAVQSQNGSAVYSLAANDDVRNMLAALSTLDWRQRQLLFGRTHPSNRTGDDTTGPDAA